MVAGGESPGRGTQIWEGNQGKECGESDRIKREPRGGEGEEKTAELENSAGCAAGRVRRGRGRPSTEGGRAQHTAPAQRGPIPSTQHGPLLPQGEHFSKEAENLDFFFF